MIQSAMRYLRTLRNLQRISFSVSRGAAARQLRELKAASPASWEFAGFSQNGEDGILEVLLANLLHSNRYFVEIGSADGLENNTAWLSIVRRYSGLWVEGDTVTARRAQEFFTPLAYGLDIREMFVTGENAKDVVSLCRYRNPDVFSLDIDSHDYFVATSVFEAGLAPKVCVVEYNSAFGPEMAVTVPEKRSHSARAQPGDNLYYGCSLTAWRIFFGRRGYRFVTVEQNGVNAIFVDPSQFGEDFLASIESLDFAENYSQTREYGPGWERQFKLISSRPLSAVAL